YRDIRSCLPEDYRRYKMNITADGRPIEYLVPNALRRGKAEKSKLWKKEHDNEDERWVTNISRPYKISKGLDGHHISLCQSHGRYYDASKGGWVWQRPRLFCRT
ncbi:MAG: xanthan lyase, partial [Bacteroidaceae bacterium]|nr:xanthan lyase [Bacteroidaceae bacterium]